MKQKSLAMLLAVALSACSTASQALPTKKHTGLEWSKYSDPSATGLYLYWKRPEDVGYVDARKAAVQFSSVQQEATRDVLPNVSPLVPSVKGLLCFKMTAFDKDNHESAFSNEACGWYGLPEPTAVKAVE